MLGSNDKARGKTEKTELRTIDAEKQVGWWLYKMTKATYIGRAESRDLGRIFGGFYRHWELHSH